MFNNRGNCPKCAGTGYIEHYKHVASGNCFMCNGTGWVRANGKAYEQFTVRDIVNPLPGLTKTQTAILYTEIERLRIKGEFHFQEFPWTQLSEDWQKIAGAGFVTITETVYNRRAAWVCMPTTSIIDWENIRK